MNERDKLAAALTAMGALPVPIGAAATAAELGKDTHGQAPRMGESTPAFRPALRAAAFLSGARRGRDVTAVSGG
ncbi:hypothetical protein [Streptomyces sp. NPDC014623]|uniref:hypothetical protein n=1 Tax=Streptomyces sp. NPDC014623 TaxID=3364875 RepID=UPI0036F58793